MAREAATIQSPVAGRRLNAPGKAPMRPRKRQYPGTLDRSAPNAGVHDPASWGACLPQGVSVGEYLGADGGASPRARRPGNGCPAT